jgi:hypothetical protein
VFVADSITCSALIEEKEAAPSKPFKHNGPFWLWFDNLFALDMPWLIGGGINMARLEEGEVSLATITVSGGGDEGWELTADEEGPLKFAGKENVDISGMAIAAKHYVLKSDKESMDLWITDSGLVLKMQSVEQIAFVLANYKQYKKLIPELPVERDQNEAAP